MIIVIEGADGTGKTTLAREIIGRFGVDSAVYLHSTYAPDQWSYDVDILQRAVRAHLDGSVAVIDRHWIGDNVYNRAFRGSPGGLWVRRLDSVLRRYGTTYVLAAPPVSAAIKLFDEARKQRPEMYDTMADVARRYRELWDGGAPDLGEAANYVEQEAVHGWESRDDTILYDRRLWNRSPADYILAFAQACAATTRYRVPAYIGDNLTGIFDSRLGAASTTLLVGNRVPRVREFNWPFFEPTGDADYLTRAIHRLKVSETDLAYTNAYRADGTPEPGLGLLAAAARRVIALGRDAAAAVHAARVPDFRTIPHPAEARAINMPIDAYAIKLQGAAL